MTATGSALSSRRRVRAAVVAVLAVALAALASIGAQPAAASEQGAAWLRIHQNSIPSKLVAGQPALVELMIANVGDASITSTAGHPIKIVDTLPAGWTPTKVFLVEYPRNNRAECSIAANVVTCEKSEEGTQSLAPFEWLEMKIEGPVPNLAPGHYPNKVTVEGAQSPTGPVTVPASESALNVSTEPTGFGVEQYKFTPEDENGGPELQAGSHPFQLSTFLHFNTIRYAYPFNPPPPREEDSNVEQLKNARVDLPPGLVGDTRAVPQCTSSEFAALASNGESNHCPKDTVIGAALVFIDEEYAIGEVGLAEPVFNLVPAKGEPARFGFVAVGGVPVVFDTAVNGGDFHVVVNVTEAPEPYALLSTLVSIWGSPGDKHHDSSRGRDCLARGFLVSNVEPEEQEPCQPTTEAERAKQPFLDMPTYCAGPLSSQVAVQPWTAGKEFTPAVFAEPFQLTGCNSVPFTPEELKIQPTEHRTSTPTGLKVLLKTPQKTTLESGQIAEADIRNTKVVFPEGMQLSPSAATGLEACSESAVGFTGLSPLGTAEFRHEIAKEESAAEEKTGEEEGRLCPAASKVGTVRVKTPLLETELKGSVYLAEQEHNPYGSLFGVYVVAKDPKTGVVVKLAGKVTLNETTGQITSEFNDAPQAPFEEFELELLNGPRASLATPATCKPQPYETTATLEPWSGTPPPALPTAPLAFTLNEGPEGGACPGGSLPFAVGFKAGAEHTQAGAFTPFTVVLSRAPGQQQPTNLTMTLPPGIAGMLSQVKQCPEPQANLGTCGPESLIGSASATVGLGSSPFTEGGGRVYITGPYQGAPFGLSVVLPAKAGPFNFGYVVTRSKISVNQTTAQITISSELPTYVNTLGFPGSACSSPCKTGVPVQLRQVVVKVERPGNAPFEFNPTNCSPMNITGTLSGDGGATMPISEPFQVSGCQNLPFKPEFSLETGSNYTRTEGTFLKVRVKEKPGEANIAKTKLVFPLQLPSRLTTLQQACLAATFEHNPAQCPVHSVIGTATAHTPVLTSALTGPVYLVSHGGAEFPDAEFILQGEGVTLILDGKTNIHNGITSSTFESVPDAPVESFEVNLPKGLFSAFTGYENLCEPTTTEMKRVTTTVTVGKGKHKKKKKVVKTVEVKTPIPHGLVSPAILTGQNGNVINEEIKIHVAECAAVQSFKKSKPKSKSKKHKHKRTSRKKHH